MRSKQYCLYLIVCLYNLLFLFAVIVDVLLPIPRSIQAISLIIIDCLYLSLYGGGESPLLKRQDTPFSLCFKLYFLLLIVQSAISLRSGDVSTAFLALSLCLIAVLFWKILDNAYSHTNSIKEVISPYLFITKYVLIASIIVFLCLLLGITSLYKFSVDPTRFDLFNGNYETGGYSIYHPLRLVFIAGNDRGINFFGQFGTFFGICHEPHLSTFLLTPAFFMILACGKKKLFWLVIFLINVLLACSVTNMVITAICIVLYFVTEYHYLPKVIRYIAYFLLATFILYICSNFSSLVERVGLEIISNKMQSGNASYDTSINILSYMYSPKSLLGTGILIYCFNPKASDIGIVSFVLNVLFQLSFVFGIVRIMLNGDRMAKIFGIGLMYFILHSLKIGQMIYQFPFLILMLFIGNMVLDKYNGNERKLS